MYILKIIEKAIAILHVGTTGNKETECGRGEKELICIIQQQQKQKTNIVYIIHLGHKSNLHTNMARFP
jgi:hypothetical protein